MFPFVWVLLWIATCPRTLSTSSYSPHVHYQPSFKVAKYFHIHSFYWWIILQLLYHCHMSHCRFIFFLGGLLGPRGENKSKEKGRWSWRWWQCGQCQSFISADWPEPRSSLTGTSLNLPVISHLSNLLFSFVCFNQTLVKATSFWILLWINTHNSACFLPHLKATSLIVLASLALLHFEFLMMENQIISYHICISHLFHAHIYCKSTLTELTFPFTHLSPSLFGLLLAQELWVQVLSLCSLSSFKVSIYIFAAFINGWYCDYGIFIVCQIADQSFLSTDASTSCLGVLVVDVNLSSWQTDQSFDWHGLHLTFLSYLTFHMFYSHLYLPTRLSSKLLLSKSSLESTPSTALAFYHI
jgi:hypothetical protein